MHELLKELVVDLRRRQASCDKLAKESAHIDFGRLTGKASAYGHAAEMLEAILKESPES